MNEDLGELWGIALYLVSLVGELPAIIARAFILFIFVELYFLIARVPLTSQGDQLSSLGWWIFFIAIYPVLFSLATLLFLPSGGGLLTRQEMNARKPSDRERNAISQALDVLTLDRPGVERPKRFYVVNALDQNAYVVGTTLYIAKGLFDTPWFIPLIAHELGHLNSLDGRLTVAARRMVFPGLFRFGGYLLRTRPAGCMSLFYGLLFMVLSGGMGLAISSWFWHLYLRRREYAADDYAASLGQAMPLADYLGRYLYLDIVLPYVGSYHPPAEYRIDRLLSYEERRAAVEERIAARVRRREESWLNRPAPDWLMKSGFGRWFMREREKQQQQSPMERIKEAWREGLQESATPEQESKPTIVAEEPLDRPLTWREKLHADAERIRAEKAAKRAQAQAQTSEAAQQAEIPAPALSVSGVAEIDTSEEPIEYETATPAEWSVLPALIDLSDLRARYQWNDAVQAELQAGTHAQIRQICERSQGDGVAGAPTLSGHDASVERLEEVGTATPTEQDPWRSVIDLTDLRTRYRWDDATQARMEEGARIAVVQQFEVPGDPEAGSQAVEEVSQGDQASD